MFSTGTTERPSSRANRSGQFALVMGVALCAACSQPDDDVGATQLSVRSGDEVVLDGEGLFGEADASTAFLWEQLDGPDVPLGDVAASSIRFIAPDVAVATLIVLRLTAQKLDLSATTIFHVTVFPRTSDAGTGASDGGTSEQDSGGSGNEPTTLALDAIADTYVSEDAPSSNYGTRGKLKTDQNPDERIYVKFRVDGIVGTVTQARLRLYVTNGSSSGPAVHSASPDWLENTLTWDSQSGPGTLLANGGSVSSGGWAEYDVTAQSIGDGEVAFALIPTSSDGCDFESREGGAAPQLVLEINGGTSSGCGDGTCSAAEDCSSCSADCGSCPGGEVCGDGTCGPGEDCSGCSADCGACPGGEVCGDGTCATSEDCLSCAADCGNCPVSTSECLSRPQVALFDGVYTDQVAVDDPAVGLTIDARTALSLTTGIKALEVGDNTLAEDICIVGWTVIGQQARDEIWRVMHDDIGGSAIRVFGSNYIVDGMRADNVQDGFDPRSGEGFVLRNSWTEYVRDDCIENDELMEGSVIDSLFDGCYTFFSEQEGGDVEGETLLLDHVLARLQPLPGPRGETDPTILGHGSFFKKFDYGGRHEPIIRDSVFFLEEDCYSGCEDWPPGTQATNVTVVWVGEGEFPMSLLPGMTLTTDRTVWEDAVARWKERHGCTTIDRACTKLHTPDPY